MIMPRLAFEEPRGGPLAKSAQKSAQQVRQKNATETARQVEPEQVTLEPPTERLSSLLFTEEEDQQGRHRRKSERDVVVVVLKAATVAAGLALVGLVILLTTTSEAQPDPRSPSVPDIPASGQPSSGPATTTELGAIVVPPVYSHTTEMAPPPTTTTTTQPSSPPNTTTGDQGQFVRLGDPCDTRGAYAFTASREPVVCATGRRGDRLVWRRVFG
jgi:hypothetical protein